MSLTIVTTCKEYSDYLVWSILYNSLHGYEQIIVTSSNDIKTIETCKRHGVRYVISDKWNHRGPFNKGCMINDALAIVKTPWILLADADILLTLDIPWSEIDENAIYGVRRIICDDQSTFRTWWNRGTPNDALFGLGPIDNARFSEEQYAMMGYFQLFHKSHNRKYSENYGTAERSDVIFALQWDHRKLLSDRYVVHLGRPCINWRGRVSQSWTQNISTFNNERW